jgi:hypothetical protein
LAKVTWFWKSGVRFFSFFLAGETILFWVLFDSVFLFFFTSDFVSWFWFTVNV